MDYLKNELDEIGFLYPKHKVKVCLKIFKQCFYVRH